jgi:8-oxo-dGTP pyrophosphatase MutT (NUDIX family)
MSRTAVRVILLDESDRVLLVRFWDGDRSWWCAPGGGIEDGESDEEAAGRELAEEVGLPHVELGPHIWVRRHVGVFRGRPFDQRERYLVARTDRFEPAPSAHKPVEHEPRDMRWWSLEELGESDEDFAPRRLPTLLRALLEGGPPAEPLDVGV